MSSTHLGSTADTCKRVDDKIRFWIVNGTVICSSTAICAVEHLRLYDIFRPGSARVFLCLHAGDLTSLPMGSQTHRRYTLFVLFWFTAPTCHLTGICIQKYFRRPHEFRPSVVNLLNFIPAHGKASDAANRTVYKSPKVGCPCSESHN